MADWYWYRLAGVKSGVGYKTPGFKPMVKIAGKHATVYVRSTQNTRREDPQAEMKHRIRLEASKIGYKVEESKSKYVYALYIMPKEMNIEQAKTVGKLIIVPSWEKARVVIEKLKNERGV